MQVGVRCDNENVLEESNLFLCQNMIYCVADSLVTVYQCVTVSIYMMLAVNCKQFSERNSS